MKIAVEGCAHGELENIYNTIAMIEERENIKIDLLLCCGDFQSTRNVNDLNCMAVPKKYQDICTFYKYYSGEKVAPILTIFIGGNHEASNYLQELPYGGWVAPNIYYLGYAGVVNVNGIRIGGVSGIYKGFDFYKGHFEFAPFDESTKRSVYHIRQLDVFRMKQLTPTVDIMMSHDWPRGCYNYGNSNQLLRFKPHFRDDINNNKLGSPPLEDLLNTLKPKYWFAAHLHCKFSAFIPHDNAEHGGTKFLALDKCLPRRRFLQILDIETAASEEIKMSYDIEWLSVLQTTNHLVSTKCTSSYMPGPSSPYRWNFMPTDDEINLTRKKLHDDLAIPSNFCRTAEPYNGSQSKYNSVQPKAQLNPQTTTFCEVLEIDDPLTLAVLMNGHELNNSSYIDTSIVDSEIESTFNTSSEMTPIKQRLSLTLPTPKLDDKKDNPDEVHLSESDSDNGDSPSKTDAIQSSFVESTISSSFVESTISSSFYSSDTFAPTTDNTTTTTNCSGSLQSSNPDASLSIENLPESSPKRTADMNADETTQIKKFKRRNQAIYANSDD